ncbi:hypothetical protein HSBAA_09790 [Vreelandella sulfidaeris]|uniref:Uncharacterized protein n=1 Tax=Vreelandella sulfidaeris TaxID=115553 RepID=A0A455U3B1_9GAMM|nr:hypothetical protein HSBAA_09790 [Halomonas sulfidaeris]
MRVEWGQHKPQLVAQEAELEQAEQKLQRDKEHLKTTSRRHAKPTKARSAR